MESKKTNREKLMKNLQSRMDDIQEWSDNMNSDDDDVRKEHIDDLTNNILSVDIKHTYDILLSFGGPSDGFKVICSADNELENIIYWWADWFEYEEVTLCDEEVADVILAYSGVLEMHEIKY